MNSTDGVTTIIGSNVRAIEIYECSDPRLQLDQPIKRMRVMAWDKRDNEVKDVTFPIRVFRDIIRVHDIAVEKCRIHGFHQMPKSYKIVRSGEGMRVNYSVTGLYDKEKIVIDSEKAPVIEKNPEPASNSIFQLEVE
jgi:hypothetical protein